MKLVDLADQIYREIDSPTDISIASIIYWLQNNIGELNIMLGTDTEYDEDTNEFIDELPVDESNIFKLLYLVRFYSKQVKSNLGASAYDWSEISEGDSTIRRVSKNEIAKTYKQMRDAADQELMRVINRYHIAKSSPESYDRSSSLLLDDIY